MRGQIRKREKCQITVKFVRGHKKGRRCQYNLNSFFQKYTFGGSFSVANIYSSSLASTSPFATIKIRQVQLWLRWQGALGTSMQNKELPRGSKERFSNGSWQRHLKLLNAAVLFCFHFISFVPIARYFLI